MGDGKSEGIDVGTVGVADDVVVDDGVVDDGVVDEVVDYVVVDGVGEAGQADPDVGQAGQSHRSDTCAKNQRMRLCQRGPRSLESRYRNFNLHKSKQLRKHAGRAAEDANLWKKTHFSILHVNIQCLMNKIPEVVARIRLMKVKPAILCSTRRGWMLRLRKYISRDIR
jgi:hypothetical protein